MLAITWELLNSEQMSLSELRDPLQPRTKADGENKFYRSLESYAGHIITTDDIEVST
jgi:hypothetical protein